MKYFPKSIIITISIITLVTPYCPDRWPCECWTTNDNIFVVHCEKRVDGHHRVLRIAYKPYISMSISCLENPLWWFDVPDSMKELPTVASITFKHCGLHDDNTTLNQVISHFVDGSVNELEFENYYRLAMNMTFSRKHFADLKGIRKLGLSNNNLTEVSVDLFHDLIDLRHLNMSKNHLTRLPIGFLDLPSLVNIDLSYNQLEVVEYGLFSRLQSLKSLKLEFNQLTELPPGIFDNLTSLVNLNIAGNNLKQLPSGIFGNLRLLMDIDLSRNNLTSDGIPGDIFRSNKNLGKITLAYNKQPLDTLPEDIFLNLKRLHTIYLNNNKLAKIPKRLFFELYYLQNVFLSGNEIREIPESLFHDCVVLNIVDFRDNQITDLPVELFGFSRRVTELDLSQNQLKEINTKLLENIRLLRVLNLTSNRIQKINKEGPCFETHGLCSTFIDEVYLNDNRLETVPSAFFSSNTLKILTLHNNAMKNITMRDFHFFKGHLKITYAYNQIETISFEGYNNSLMNASRIELSIGSNPINCDCRMLDFLKYRSSKSVELHQHPIVIDVQGTHCEEPRELRSTPLAELDGTPLECLVDDPKTLAATCPKKCQCWDKPQVQIYRIDCSYRNLTKAPGHLQGPKGYQIDLNLSGNLIKKMPSMLQLGYQDVTKLNLSHNLITSMNPESISRNLEILVLNSNHLRRLGTQVLRQLEESKQLTHLELHGNPWICNCDTVDFLEFIQANAAFKADLKKVTCDSFNYPMFQMTSEDICEVPVSFFIIIGSVIALLGLVIGIISLIYHVYEREIKVWLYSRQWCLWFVTEDELDKDKEYDAFISFSHMDDDLVTKTLIPTLEDSPHPYRLCVHYRDWIPGESIPSQIIHSVESSKRTIIILSPHFLESVWSRIEFRAAHEQALNEHRSRVIIVLYGEIGSIDNLDSEIKAYLKMNTYVKWGDPWFWEKLRYALPHSGLIQKIKNNKRRTAELSDQQIQYFNDTRTLSTTL